MYLVAAGITIAITERVIPIALFGVFAKFDFPVENAEWNFDPEPYDEGVRGY